jgi:hypothetical protein
MGIHFLKIFIKKNNLRKRLFFVLTLMPFLFLDAFIYAEDFTPALWLDDSQDSESWGWIRLNNGHWWVVMPDYRGFMINDMKINYQQKGVVLYGYNTENELYDIPEARINEETSAYIVIYWYTNRLQKRLEKIQDPVNIYVPNYGDGGDRYIGTLNAIGDE